MTVRAHPIRPDQGFSGLIGLELTELTDEIASGRVVVRDELTQPHGPVHGGVYASIAESLASFGTGAAVGSDGKVARTLSNQASFLRPITQGAIHAHATRRHRGRTTWVWEVEIFDDDDQLCGLARVTVAVREPGS